MIDAWLICQTYLLLANSKCRVLQILYGLHKHFANLVPIALTKAVLANSHFSIFWNNIHYSGELILLTIKFYHSIFINDCLDGIQKSAIKYVCKNMYPPVSLMIWLWIYTNTYPHQSNSISYYVYICNTCCIVYKVHDLVHTYNFKCYNF